MTADEHDPAEVRAVVNRLKRAQGQLSAVIGMIDEGRDCREVVTQLAAVSKAVDRAAFKIVAVNLRACLSGSDPGGHDEQELEKLLLSLL